MELAFFKELELKTLADKEGAEQAMWAKNLEPCTSPEKFRDEAIWVILCSGISYKAARTMEKTLIDTGVCNHPHKNSAIQKWKLNYLSWWEYWESFKYEDQRMEFLSTLPYFGGKALKYQFAKNMGITGFCKPDVHLVRLADKYGFETPQLMCEKLAKETGETVAYIDTIVWFSAMKKWAYQ